MPFATGIELKRRRSVQSYIGIDFFSLRRHWFDDAANSTFLGGASVLNNALTNEVRIEES